MNLADPATLKSFLGRHGIRAEKGLGQHFLASSKVVERIVALLESMRGILEIGPGPGVLTGPLSELCERMIALELDPRMAELLSESAPRCEVLEQDALRADLDELLATLPEPRAIVSNLPYYITGPLLTKVAASRRSMAIAVLMMQKEVAERVMAEPRTPMRGSLSVFLQSQFAIRSIAHAPAGAFLPPPKVDSAVLEFVPRKPEFQPEEEGPFFRLVRLGFAMPRKTLINNLVAGYRLSRPNAEGIVVRAGLGPKTRPQEMSEMEWLALLRALGPVALER